MKLRNLIFGLFLAIGAIGFTACTGDDGATGPAGPAGPQGPPGEPAEPGDAGDSGDSTNFYSFLKKWGSMTGEIGCSSPLLTGEGPLPGPDLMPFDEDMVDRSDNSLNENVVAACDSTVYDSVGTVKIGGQDVTLAGSNSIILYKTGRAQEVSTEEMPSTEFSRAKKVTTTKQFVGGLVFAEAVNTTDESLERGLLYSDCGVGTDPPALRGTWKAVQVSTATREFSNGEQVSPALNVNEGVPTPVVTLTKVCVVLDAHPGVTKCLVAQPKDDGSGTERSIALYDGTNLHTVVEDISTLTADNSSFATDGTEILFNATAADFEDVEQLCNF